MKMMPDIFQLSKELTGLCADLEWAFSELSSRLSLENADRLLLRLRASENFVQHIRYQLAEDMDNE